MEPVEAKVLDGLLEGLVLHAIEEEPSHGYGILKDLEAAIGEEPSKNRIYRVLRDLEEEGFVESEEVTEESRTRQVYSLTPQGADRLREFRDLPAPFKGWLAGLFGIDGAGEPRRARDRTREPEPTELETEPEPGWVQEQLAQLPTDPPIQAPHARYTLDRAPGEGRWELTVERHDPGAYEGADECALTFVYLAIQRMLFQTPRRR